MNDVLRKIILMVPSLFRLARLNMRAVVMNILIMKFYLLSCRFLFFLPKYFPCYPVVNKTLELCFSTRREITFKPVENTT